MPLTLEPYELREEISRGCWRAWHPGMGRECLIVVVSALRLREHDRRELLDRAERLATIDHPSLPCLYDVVELDGGLVLISEFVAGVPLSDMLRQPEAATALPPYSWAMLVGELAAAMQYAHDRNVYDGEITLAKVNISNQTLARFGQFGVTPPAADGLSEEQLRRRDIAALGMILRSTVEAVQIGAHGVVGTPAHPAADEILARSQPRDNQLCAALLAYATSLENLSAPVPRSRGTSASRPPTAQEVVSRIDEIVTAWRRQHGLLVADVDASVADEAAALALERVRSRGRRAVILAASMLSAIALLSLIYFLFNSSSPRHPAPRAPSPTASASGITAARLDRQVLPHVFDPRGEPGSEPSSSRGELPTSDYSDEGLPDLARASVFHRDDPGPAAAAGGVDFGKETREANRGQEETAVTSVAEPPPVARPPSEPVATPQPAGPAAAAAAAAASDVPLNPFDPQLTTVDLPAAADGAVTLVPLLGDDPPLVAELVGGEQALPGRKRFELAASGPNRWEIRLSEKEEVSTTMAELWVERNLVRFRRSSAASEGALLRNCFLRLRSGRFEQLIGLRQVQREPALVFDMEGGSERYRYSIEDAPPAKFLKAEPIVVGDESPPQRLLSEPMTPVLNGQISLGLGQGDHPPLALLLQVSWKRQLELNVSASAVTAAGPQILGKANAARWAAASTALNQRIYQAKFVAESLRGEARDRFQRDLQALEKQVEQLEAMRELYELSRQTACRFVIWYELDEGLRLELLRIGDGMGGRE